MTRRVFTGVVALLFTHAHTSRPFRLAFLRGGATSFGRGVVAQRRRWRRRRRAARTLCVVGAARRHNRSVPLGLQRVVTIVVRRHWRGRCFRRRLAGKRAVAAHSATRRAHADRQRGQLLHEQTFERHSQVVQRRVYVKTRQIVHPAHNVTLTHNTLSI